ncbi:hypothetical protein RB195_003738 [Necator americanus]|uniref:G-protein coupled receptors family 1 profile domain-containing protein n=1 Tax=Necator americanus TaxID=51031 RepID=A0ABR1DPX2_NECAM
MEYAGNIYSEQYCEKEGVTAATNPMSCIGNTLYTIISIISLVLLPIVAVKYRKRFIFHTNVLILTYNFFAASFLHAFLFAITQVKLSQNISVARVIKLKKKLKSSRRIAMLWEKLI